MNLTNAITAASGAVAANRTRPATAVIHDSPDMRLVVFRIEAGQAVSPHHNKSTVALTILEGSGTVTGAEGQTRECARGDVVTYAPGELHGMQAARERLLILATISPRPGDR